MVSSDVTMVPNVLEKIGFVTHLMIVEIIQTNKIALAPRPSDLGDLKALRDLGRDPDQEPRPTSEQIHIFYKQLDFSYRLGVANEILVNESEKFLG